MKDYLSFLAVIVSLLEIKVEYGVYILPKYLSKDLSIYLQLVSLRKPDTPKNLNGEPLP